MLDSLSHAITYATFQVMINFFAVSDLSKMTQEQDFISIKPQEMVRLLEQPKTAAIRYYFTLTPKGKLSAVVMGLDSAAQEQRTIILNAPNAKQAEKAIQEYADKKMVQRTGTTYGTIGIASTSGKIIYSNGKEELLQLARSTKEIRAFYALKEDPATKAKHLVLCFAQVDETGGVVMQSAKMGTSTVLDASFDCPPFCRQQ
jgi:hypothetical protein